MNIDKRFELIKRNTEEIIGEDKIKKFMKRGIVYCGYECSGEIHIGHMVTILKLLDLQKAGIKVKVLLADWHTWLNKKGDWNFVNKQLKQWEKGFKSIGLKAEIVKGTSYQKKSDYFEDILKLALNITVNRGVRAMQQVARDIENAKISQIIYPLLQVADVKYLGTNFVVAGTDQRKIYMLGVDEGKDIELQEAVYLYTPMIPSLRGATASKEEFELVEVGYAKPSEVFENYNLKIVDVDSPEKREEHLGFAAHMKLIESIIGTTKEKKISFKLKVSGPKGDFEESFKIGQGKPVGDLFISLENAKDGKIILKVYGVQKQKMSSSVKESFISIRDKKQDIKKKVVGAYCRKGDVVNNPVLSIVKLIVFPKFEKIKVKRSDKFGGNIEFKDYKSLEDAFESGELHSLDLKNAVVDYLELIIAPIRKNWK